MATAQAIQAEEQFRQVFEKAPIGMAIVSFDGYFQRVNQALCKTLGYSTEELLAITFQHIIHPEDADTNLVLYHKALGKNILSDYEIEQRCIKRDGSVINVVLQATLVRNENGKPDHFIAQFVDITERQANRGC